MKFIILLNFKIFKVIFSSSHLLIGCLSALGVSYENDSKNLIQPAFGTAFKKIFKNQGSIRCQIRGIPVYKKGDLYGNSFIYLFRKIGKFDVSFLQIMIDFTMKSDFGIRIAALGLVIVEPTTN
jgi:hypothetical protein